MKSFDEWKEANLDEQLGVNRDSAVVPTAMGKIEKAKLMGKSGSYLQRWIDQMSSSGPLTKARKLSALAQVAEALGLSPQEIALMGAKVKGAIKKDASAAPDAPAAPAPDAK
jgi:hypothetical protein